MAPEFRNIFTLSLNPAFDITLWIEPIGIEKIHLIEHEIKNPAGKGVNVSRTLSRFNVRNKALIVAGTDNKDTFFTPLSAENIDCDVIFVPGSTRENYHIFCGGSLVSTMARKGFTITDDVVSSVIEKLKSYLSDGDLLIFGGRFPIGLSKQHFYDICDAVKERGALLALDSNSVDTEDILRVRPYLIKPNLAELNEIVGRNLLDSEDIWSALDEMNEKGVENIILSLDKDGLIYSGRKKRFKATVPTVSVRSTVGAGDSTLSGFIYGLQNDRELYDCVRLAASFGTASVMSEGTVPPTADDMAYVYENTSVTEI